ncbi:MAG: hypothetical protein FD119_94 [Stygiobacter sp.]|nr:MAG: hypothetical protein FD119_94 [Stygiobacter sp.]
MYSDASDSYSPRKAAQVIALLALRAGGGLDVLKAVKLVYLADRESMARHGFPILDELHVSMKHGPVNSTTYSHINGEVDLDGCGWTEFVLARENHMVAVAEGVAEDGLDELSEADVDCLDAVWRRFGAMDKWKLVDWTHDRENLPEWEDPNGSSKPIPLERTLGYLGVAHPDDQAETIREYRRIDSLFASLRR